MRRTPRALLRLTDIGPPLSEATRAQTRRISQAWPTAGTYFCFFSGATLIRTVSPELPGKSVNIASTRLGTR